jgi:rRNA maturation endonuclease Nob1
MAERNIILDTSVLWQFSDAFQPTVDLEPAHYVVPAAVVAELDTLMPNVGSRDKVRAAVNRLKRLVERGAVTGHVSWGERRTVSIESVSSEEEDARLTAAVDDRIIATALSVRDRTESVVVSTTDFMLYIKALTFGLEARFTDPPVSALVVASKQLAVSDARWRRVEEATDVWGLCRRGLMWLSSPLVTAAIAEVRASGQPPYVLSVVVNFDNLRSRWTENVSLYTLLNPVFGLLAPYTAKSQCIGHRRAPGARSWSNICESVET